MGKQNMKERLEVIKDTLKKLNEHHQEILASL